MSILEKEATSLTIDWRAGCGKSASPVRREGSRNPMRLAYPYLWRATNELLEIPEVQRQRRRMAGRSAGALEYRAAQGSRNTQ